MSWPGPDIERSFFHVKSKWIRVGDGMDVAKGLPTVNATYVKVITEILAGTRYLSLRNTPYSCSKATKEATAYLQQEMSLPE